MQNYQYYKSVFQNEQLPLAFVDLDLMDKNIDILLNRARDKRIRIASKSIRCRAVMEYIFKKNAQFQGIMAFHGAEAAFLSKNGFDDILMGYPIVDKKEIAVIGQELQKQKYICLMVDHPDHLTVIEQVGKSINQTFPICIDLDLSVDFGPIHFGVWRSQITGMALLNQLLEQIQDCKYLQLDGLMGYEAQIAGIGDAIGGRWALNKIIRLLKSRSIPKIAQKRAEAITLIREKGFDLKLVNGGGTGSLESTTEENGITEVTVGSGFYNSHLFDYYSEFQLQPAAAFALEATRHPKAGIITCHGGGYIASGETGHLKAPLPYLPKGLTLDKNEGAGEVQTPLHYQGQEMVKIGDPVFFRHSKAGELCERFKDLYFVKNGKITDVVPTYRGENQCFI